MSNVLEEVADAADDVADEQRQVARGARAMQRRRDRGWSWARILHEEAAPGVVVLLRRSTRRLAAATGRLTQALVAGLSGEGESRRKIARRLGVTHQRISAIVKSGNRPPDDGTR
jgi:hypothetical protein